MVGDTPLLDAAGRAQTKRWLDDWRRTAPILDQERWDRVAALTDTEAQQGANRLFDLWQPDWPTDEGQGLLLHQRVFARGRR